MFDPARTSPTLGFTQKIAMFGTHTHTQVRTQTHSSHTHTQIHTHAHTDTDRRARKHRQTDRQTDRHPARFQSLLEPTTKAILPQCSEGGDKAIVSSLADQIKRFGILIHFTLHLDERIWWILSREYWVEGRPPRTTKQNPTQSLRF